MSKPLSVSNWLLPYLLTETAEKFFETDCLNTRDLSPKTQLVKVIKVRIAERECCVRTEVFPESVFAYLEYLPLPNSFVQFLINEHCTVPTAAWFLF